MEQKINKYILNRIETMKDQVDEKKCTIRMKAYWIHTKKSMLYVVVDKSLPLTLDRNDMNEHKLFLTKLKKQFKFNTDYFRMIKAYAEHHQIQQVMIIAPKIGAFKNEMFQNKTPYFIFVQTIHADPAQQNHILSHRPQVLSCSKKVPFIDADDTQILMHGLKVGDIVEIRPSIIRKVFFPYHLH